MKKLLLLFACVTLFAGCDRTSIRQGREAYKEYLEDILKDPESLRIYEETVIESDDNSAKFEIDYGAKNSLGGYVRDTYYFYTVGTTVVKHGKFLSDISTHVGQEAQKKMYPDKYTECEKKGMFAPYWYLTNLVTAAPLVKYSTGQTVNLKGDVLAIRFGSFEFDDVLKNKNAEIFNERFYDQDYLILPKGTSALIEDVADDFYKTKVTVDSKTDTYYLPLSLD